MTNYCHEENVIDTTTIFKMQMHQITEKIVKELQDIYGVDVIYKEESDEEEEKFKLKIWSKLLLKWKTKSLKYMVLWKKSTSTLWKSQGLLTSIISYPLT